MGKSQEFLTPKGRLVQGDCFEPQTKKMDGSPILDKQGQPSQRYFVGIAFKKTDAEFAKLKAMFDSVARVSFPHLFPTPGGPCINPNFSTKIIDGDGFDQNGKSNATKEGFAGHWVLRMSSSYPPKCFAAGKYAPHEQLHAANGVNPIPRGHYVRVAGSVNDNNSGSTVNAKPGLYVNCNMIEWVELGDVIMSGPDAATVFGGGVAAAPGASGPVMLNGQNYATLKGLGWTDEQMVQHGHMQAPAAVAPPPAPPAAVAPPPPAPAAPPPPVIPHTSILTGPVMLNGQNYATLKGLGWTDEQMVQHGHMQAPAAVAPPPLAPPGSVQAPPPPVPAAPAPVAGKRMLPAAGTTTYDEYIKAGWTDAALIQNGFMAV